MKKLFLLLFSFVLLQLHAQETPVGRTITPARDLSIKRGDVMTGNITFTRNNTAFSLDSVTVFFRIYVPGRATPVLVLSNGDGFTSPTGARCMLEVVVPITSTAAASQLRTVFPNAATAVNTGNVLGTGVTAINSNHTSFIRGFVVNGSTAGNFQVQFATEVNASAVTLQIGSELQLIKVN